jgi:hypothetical protein
MPLSELRKEYRLRVNAASAKWSFGVRGRAIEREIGMCTASAAIMAARSDSKRINSSGRARQDYSRVALPKLDRPPRGICKAGEDVPINC